ncbi:MAG: hypothetical protein AAFO07_28295 [Bacteroidota bacterium]
MNSIIIFIALIILNKSYINEMDEPNNCALTLNRTQILERLKDQGKDEYSVDDALNDSNSACLYYLDQGEIIVYLLGSETGLLVKNSACLDKFLSEDYFPIKVPDSKKKSLYHFREQVRNIHLEINFFQEVLNRKLFLEYRDIDLKSTRRYCIDAHNYLHEQMNQEKFDYEVLIALIAVVAEYTRKQTSGKWLLRKMYFYYNPAYEIYILDSNNKVIIVDGIVKGFIENPVADFDFLLKRLIELEDYRFEFSNSPMHYVIP